MTAEYWRMFRILCIVGVCSGLIHWQYATGFALGAVIGYWNYRRTERFWNSIVDRGQAPKFTGAFHQIGTYALMAGSMILCALYPDYLNIFANALGLCIIKLSVVFSTMFYGKEG